MTTLIALVATGLFAMACLALWNVMRGFDFERRREAQSPAIQVVEGSCGGQRCVLCDQPLRRVASSDEVVCAIERHIGDETATVLRLLMRPVPENLQRLYLA